MSRHLRYQDSWDIKTLVLSNLNLLKDTAGTYSWQHGTLSIIDTSLKLDGDISMHLRKVNCQLRKKYFTKIAVLVILIKENTIKEKSHQQQVS